MKRLVATLAAVIFSITAGVQFINPKPDEFVLTTSAGSAYWSPSSDNNINSADIYRMVYGTYSDGKTKCDITNTVPNRMAWAQASPYWPCITIVEDDEAGEDVANSADESALVNNANMAVLDQNVSKYVFKAPTDSGRYYICAPCTGTIETSHYACDYGHTMTFKFDYDRYTWYMDIRECERWYCCRNKTDKDKTESNGKVYFTASTKDNLKGHRVRAGGMLAIGTASTEITITRGDPIS